MSSFLLVLESSDRFRKFLSELLNNLLMSPILLSFQSCDRFSKLVDFSADFALLRILIGLTENHAFGEAVNSLLEIRATLRHNFLSHFDHRAQLAFPSVHLRELLIKDDYVKESRIAVADVFILDLMVRIQRIGEMVALNLFHV